MIYKYTKCESVIAKIMADLDSSETRQRTSDIKEWIFEAIDKIGAPMQYISRQSGVDGVPVFSVQDCQIPLPSDLVHLDGVAYSNSKMEYMYHVVHKHLYLNLQAYIIISIKLQS